MPLTCPCCRRPVEAAAIVDLDRNVIATEAGAVALMPREAEVAYVLANRTRRILPEAMLGEIWGATEPSPAAVNGVQVQISHLRKKLAPLGLTISCVRHRGYLLEPMRTSMH
jgi:DNA-binding response OmpR family regulator